jgi:hypothetical protein
LRGEVPLNVTASVLSLVFVVALCASGFWYFRRVEKVFADVI